MSTALKICWVAADGLEALVPDQAADRPRLVGEQPAERARMAR